LKLCELSYSVILGEFSLFSFPGLDKICGPEYIDKGKDKDKDIVETSKAAAAYRTNVFLLHPQ
jgi:hypothetical protein